MTDREYSVYVVILFLKPLQSRLDDDCPAKYKTLEKFEIDVDKNIRKWHRT